MTHAHAQWIAAIQTRVRDVLTALSRATATKQTKRPAFAIGGHSREHYKRYVVVESKSEWNFIKRVVFDSPSSDDIYYEMDDNFQLNLVWSADTLETPLHIETIVSHIPVHIHRMWSNWKVEIVPRRNAKDAPFIKIIFSTTHYDMATCIEAFCNNTDELYFNNSSGYLVLSQTQIKSKPDVQQFCPVDVFSFIQKQLR